MAILLDASAALSWCLQRSDTGEAAMSDAVMGAVEREGALVPSLWFVAVANGVLATERRGLLPVAEARGFLAILKSLPIDRDEAPAGERQERVLQLAGAFGSTAYDATYLELAERTGSRLATFDRRLAEAARAAGVGVFGD